MSSVLILGGHGYIGLNLANKLFKMKYNVILVDNLKNPAVFEPCNDLPYNFLNIDIRNYESLITVFSSFNIDLVIWSVDVLIHQTIDYYDIHINGLMNVLIIMNIYNVQKFIYLSSNDVYGNNIKAKELDNCSPLSIEGKTRLLAEDMIRNIYHYKLYILRLGQVVGKTDLTLFMGVRPNIINCLYMYQNKFFEKISISNLTQDYIYIYDLLDAIIACMNNLSKEVIQRYIVNIGSGNEYTDKQLFNIYTKKYNIKNVKHEILQEPIINQTVSVEFANSLLNWKTKHNFI